MKKNISINFSKYMIREHSLFYAHVWNEANRDIFDEFVPNTNIKNILFIFNKLGVLEVYYDLNELDSIADSIAKAITDSPELLDTIIAQFYHYWEIIFPYLEGKKKIESIDELKKYYMNWTAWWVPMAHIFMIPDHEQTPEQLRQKALKVRQDTQEYSDAGDKVVMNFIVEKYSQYKDIAIFFTPEEVYRIDTLSVDEIAIVRERLHGFVLLTLNGMTDLISPAVFTQRIATGGFILGSDSIDLSKKQFIKLNGRPASPGFVKANVRLVLKKSDLELVKFGEVMVTYATSPDYLPAMKKSSAIVTDEGGVVCHAAIVSRELKIPCIVGTKIATQVLKDGDMVEVDADKGIVKIIN